jgi:hypothetical protein
MAMSVSHLRMETPGILGPGRAKAPPPFWELEDLLAAGLSCEAALAVMAARRAGPSLVGGTGPGAGGRRRSLEPAMFARGSAALQASDQEVIPPLGESDAGATGWIAALRPGGRTAP